MPLKSGSPLPTLDGATEWINGTVDRDSLIGKPTLIYFWAVSCHICHDNMPTLREWKKTYGPLGLNFVGVHMPRQESDLDTATIRQEIAAFGIDEATAVDGEHTVGDRFQTGGFWPYYFLFDAEGNLKSRAAGDVGLGSIEGTLKRLLGVGGE